MISGLLDWFREHSPFDDASTYELLDMRSSYIRIMVFMVGSEGAICAVTGLLIGSPLLAILGGVNLTVGFIAAWFRVWVK